MLQNFDFTTIFNDVVHLAYIGIGGYVAKFVKDHLVGKVKSSYAKIAVQYVEQVLKSGDSKSKFDSASNFLSARLKKLHIKVDPQEINGLIESAVLGLNSQLDKVVASPTPQPTVVPPVQPVVEQPSQPAPVVEQPKQ